MFGRILAFRTPLATAALVAATAAAGLAPATARAQSSVTVDFNTLVDTTGGIIGARAVDNCYTESGFTFTAVNVACGTANTFVAASAANPPAFIGSPALYINDPTTHQVAITQANGGLFGIQSIVLGPFFGVGGTVGATGLLANGMTVSQSFTVADASMFAQQPSQLYTFNSMFTGLTSVRLDIMQNDGNAYLNFDDLTFTSAAATAVPEPTTVALLAGGLFGVGMLARTRGSRRRAASAPLA